MRSPIVKRSIVVAGHITSVSLEDVFWDGLRAICRQRNMSLSELLCQIDRQRKGNLSSAIRVFVLEHYVAIAAEATAPIARVHQAETASSPNAIGGIRH
ncbi:ribbon-helix-helix domain-containing protein [Bradyrhizobium sp. CCBAU 51765]|uniref:ribbon-helix-helix domain-containing protein n=1 Tax=Bradyrhizobium sp. CCBAU 51765 TaxID=1325102 RepID=UPI00188815F1|nr:ribbon-helix-helix domain-containing protein [Bradyrhizobium sp. CCBAU 51765]QOZ06665.1 aryl-sulfate sulfotransferase [Bradyrhizobium sp. CCBAU 51765]